MTSDSHSWVVQRLPPRVNENGRYENVSGFDDPLARAEVPPEIGSVAMRAVIASSQRKDRGKKRSTAQARNFRVTIRPDYRIIVAITAMTFAAFSRNELFHHGVLFAMACCLLSLCPGVPRLKKGYQDFAIYYVSGRF